MDLDFDYHRDRELYDQAFEAADYGEILELYTAESPYNDPVELLAEEEGLDAAKKVVELAEAQRILNGDSGTIAGMDLARTEASN